MTPNSTATDRRVPARKRSTRAPRQDAARRSVAPVAAGAPAGRTQHSSRITHHASLTPLDRLHHLIAGHWQAASPPRRQMARDSIRGVIGSDEDLFATAHALQCALIYLGIGPSNYTACVLLHGATADPASLREVAGRLNQMLTDLLK